MKTKWFLFNTDEEGALLWALVFFGIGFVVNGITHSLMGNASFNIMYPVISGITAVVLGWVFVSTSSLIEQGRWFDIATTVFGAWFLVSIGLVIAGILAIVVFLTYLFPFLFALFVR